MAGWTSVAPAAGLAAVSGVLHRLRPVVAAGEPAPRTRACRRAGQADQGASRRAGRARTTHFAQAPRAPGARLSWPPGCTSLSSVGPAATTAARPSARPGELGAIVDRPGVVPVVGLLAARIRALSVVEQCRIARSRALSASVSVPARLPASTRPV